MTNNFTTAFSVDQTPEQVFAAITNVRGWWSGQIDGDTANVGDEFTYRYKDIHYTKQLVTEAIAGKRVVWKILDAYLKFTEDKTEWTGTEVVFDIARKGDRTELRFTHAGLVPALQCYELCTGGWTMYIDDSLRKLITTGKGRPNAPD